MNLKISVYSMSEIHLLDVSLCCVIKFEKYFSHLQPTPFSPKQKNITLWNKSCEFKLDKIFDFVSEKLEIFVNEHKKDGTEIFIGSVFIYLNELKMNQELRKTYIIQYTPNIEIDVGILVNISDPPPEPAHDPITENTKLEGAKGLDSPFGVHNVELTQPKRELTKFKPEDIQRIFPNIGQGTYGVVYKGHVVGIEGLVVVKDLNINNNHQIIEDWQREVNIMSKLRSPYLAEIFGYSWEPSGTIVTIIMEFFPLGDLFKVLHREKHVYLSLPQRIRMARHCALAVYVLHKEGFIHRDIKSLNVLVADDFSCKLSDFGMAKMIKYEGSQATIVFNTEGKGTPVWMAPEVKNPQQKISLYSFPADIYSLGVVLFEILERSLPWDEIQGKVVFPPQYQSSGLLEPMLNPNPQLRPNATTVISNLDTYTRDIILSVHQMIGFQGDEDKMDFESYLSLLFQRFLTSPPKEVDELIIKAASFVGRKASEEKLRKERSKSDRKIEKKKKEGTKEDKPKETKKDKEPKVKEKTTRLEPDVKEKRKSDKKRDEVKPKSEQKEMKTKRVSEINIRKKEDKKTAELTLDATEDLKVKRKSDKKKDKKKEETKENKHQMFSYEDLELELLPKNEQTAIPKRTKSEKKKNHVKKDSDPEGGWNKKDEPPVQTESPKGQKPEQVKKQVMDENVQALDEDNELQILPKSSRGGIFYGTAQMFKKFSPIKPKKKGYLSIEPTSEIITRSSSEEKIRLKEIPDLSSSYTPSVQPKHRPTTNIITNKTAEKRKKTLPLPQSQEKVEEKAKRHSSPSYNASDCSQ